MFGRVRAAPSSSSPSSSSSSLDWCLDLELERPPSKIIKDDSLSIYEITLNKLRLGSKRSLKSSPGEETNPSLSATTEAMKIDGPCTTTANNTSPSSNGDQCKQQMEDNSCNPPPPIFKYKRWPWTHSNGLSLNPESHQLPGHKS